MVGSQAGMGAWRRERAGLAGRRRGPSPPHAISLGRGRACMHHAWHGPGPAGDGRPGVVIRKHTEKVAGDLSPPERLAS